MDYPPISDELRAKLIREGLDAARRQAERVNGVAGAEGHRTGPARRGEEETRAPMGMGKGPGTEARPVAGEVKRQNRPGGGLASFDYVTHMGHAAGNMPTRKGARRAPFLVVIKGGRE